jgi:hypothetical protein
LEQLKNAASKEARGKIISEVLNTEEGTAVPDIAYEFKDRKLYPSWPKQAD